MVRHYYTYLWFDTDWVPYYVGKGSGRRAFVKHRNLPTPDKDHIVIYNFESEARAFEFEMELIAYYGCRWNSTGCLMNEQEGGRAPSKWTCRKGGEVARESGQISALRCGCSKGGRVSGGKNAESGHIQRIGKIARTPAHQSAAGALGGAISGPRNGSDQGKKNVESGHIAALGRAQGCRNVKSGLLASVASLGGRTANHTRWHVNRDRVSRTCSLCQEVAYASQAA